MVMTEFVNLFSIDMAPRGVDDEKMPRRSLTNSSPQAPSYVLQTTRLPFSRLVWTVLDYRIFRSSLAHYPVLNGDNEESNVLIHQVSKVIVMD